MNERSIIVGYDGSEVSDKALKQARELALRYDACLHLVHVIDWSPFEFQTHEENERQAKERRELIRSDREELFPPILKSLTAVDVEASAEVRWGHAAEVLTELALEHDAFMIVIGRTGGSNLKSLLFGSVASRTVQLADRPVLVVP